MRRHTQIVLLGSLLAIACADAPETPPPAPVDIGIHVVSLQAPEGWVPLDHGKEHRFHSDRSQISLSDLGPATPRAYLRELRHAHRLFLDNRLDDAGAQLSGMDLEYAFREVGPRKAFLESWRKARDGGRSRSVTTYDAEVAWDHILEEVERLPAIDLIVVVEQLLPSVETAAHREIAERVPLELGGRPALRIETWDRLSHDHRRSFLFVLNEGNLLVLRMEMGDYAEMKPAFETLAGSLEFHSASTTS